MSIVGSARRVNRLGSDKHGIVKKACFSQQGVHTGKDGGGVRIWSASRKGPEQVGREKRESGRAPITNGGDQSGEMAQLQSVIERVAETVGPVEERQHDESERRELDQRLIDLVHQFLVGRRREPQYEHQRG